MEDEIRELFDEFQQNTISSFDEFARYFDVDISDPEIFAEAPVFISNTSTLFAGKGNTEGQSEVMQAVYEYIRNSERIEEAGVYALLYGLAGKRYKPRKREIREKFINDAY